jgi:hypothetical protein
MVAVVGFPVACDRTAPSSRPQVELRANRKSPFRTEFNRPEGASTDSLAIHLGVDITIALASYFRHTRNARYY